MSWRHPVRSMILPQSEIQYLRKGRVIRTHPGDTGIRITVVSAYKYALDTAES